jgi:hypothetical protein
MFKCSRSIDFYPLLITRANLLCRAATSTTPSYVRTAPPLSLQPECDGAPCTSSPSCQIPTSSIYNKQIWRQAHQDTQFQIPNGPYDLQDIFSGVTSQPGCSRAPFSGEYASPRSTQCRDVETCHNSVDRYSFSNSNSKVKVDQSET